MPRRPCSQLAPPREEGCLSLPVLPSKSIQGGQLPRRRSVEEGPELQSHLGSVRVGGRWGLLCDQEQRVAGWKTYPGRAFSCYCFPEQWGFQGRTWGGSGWAASPATEKRGCQGGEWEEFQLGRGDQTHVGSLAVGLWGLPVERAASNL